MSETIGVTVTYKEPITFYLRMISIDEENKLRQKMFGLTEEQQVEKSYQNNVDLLADLATAMSADINFAEGVSLDSQIRDYFSERTIIKERIAEYAVRGYFLRLQPDVNFS